MQVIADAFELKLLKINPELVFNESVLLISCLVVLVKDAFHYLFGVKGINWLLD